MARSATSFSPAAAARIVDERLPLRCIRRINHRRRDEGTNLITPNPAGDAQRDLGRLGSGQCAQEAPDTPMPSALAKRPARVKH